MVEVGLADNARSRLSAIVQSKGKPLKEEAVMTELTLVWEVGRSYFIRTVTFHYVGKFVAERGKFIELEDASWVADSGRWNNALRTGELSEVEPYPFGVAINSDSIVDISLWKHDLPKEVL